MAQVDENDLTTGLRGKFGDQFVFRKFGDRTIAYKMRRQAESSTEKQLLHREKFRLAASYAKQSLLMPEMKAEYEAIARAKRNTTVFATAVADFLKPVTITDILIAPYKGEVCFLLTVAVNDIFKVKKMKVIISNADGAVLESGDAIGGNDSSGYSYITTAFIPDVKGVTIKAEVIDRPGNVVVKEVKLQERSPGPGVR
jgi:hypothetical protein